MIDNSNDNEQRMNSSDLKNEGRSRLSRHPWVSLVVLLLFSLIVPRKLVQAISLAGFVINPIIETAVGMVVGIIVFFGVVPYALGLPQGRTSITRYLHAIGLRRPHIACALKGKFILQSSERYFLGKRWV